MSFRKGGGVHEVKVKKSEKKQKKSGESAARS